MNKEVKLDTEIDSVSYSLGVNIANSIRKQGVESVNADAMAKAIDDVYKNDSLLISVEETDKILQHYFTKLQSSKFESVKKDGEAFLAQNAKKEGVVTLESGLQYKIITQGTGPKPTAEDVVKTHYHGTTIDGNVFDSSVQRGEPISFPLNGVIKGWTEALQLMPVGSKWILYIPYNLAYGERGAGEAIPPYATLIFEVELLDIEK